jgi:ABC-type nitrate/sulfonate/bicarbonate transport system substrate-binding protein
LLPVSDYVGNMSADTIFASRRLVEKNPDAIRRFLLGWFDTIAFMRKNRTETVRIARTVTEFSQTVAEREYDQCMPMFNDNGRFDAESLATLQRSMTDLKLLDHPPDMATLYTEEFLPKR